MKINQDKPTDVETLSCHPSQRRKNSGTAGDTVADPADTLPQEDLESPVILGLPTGVTSNPTPAMSPSPSAVVRSTTPTIIPSPASTKGWQFSDVAPVPFKRCRELSGISETEYSGSLGFGNFLGNLLLGRLSTIVELKSSSRSGSLFFKSGNGKYFCKTIPVEEEERILDILPAWLDYFRNNPNTLLPRLYGMYHLKRGYNLGGGHTHKDLTLLIMENVFRYLPVHEQYDLKGSTVDRLVKNVSDPNVALKDQNFKTKIRIGSARKVVLMEQIERDTQFLVTRNICDFSLLVGIHKFTTPIKPPLVDNSEHRSTPLSTLNPMGTIRSLRPQKGLIHEELGGFVSEKGDCVYYIGIIDTFTVYNFRKKGEQTAKSFLHDKSQISAMAPEPYRKRFQAYVYSIIESVGIRGRSWIPNFRWLCRADKSSSSDYIKLSAVMASTGPPPSVSTYPKRNAKAASADTTAPPKTNGWNVCSHVVVCVIGPHSGETEDSFFARKASDIALCGHTYWLCLSNQMSYDNVVCACTDAASAASNGGSTSSARRTTAAAPSSSPSSTSTTTTTSSKRGAEKDPEDSEDDEEEEEDEDEDEEEGEGEEHEEDEAEDDDGCDNRRAWCLFVAPATPGGAKDTTKSVNATEVSLDGGATWAPLDKGLTPVNGKLSKNGSLAFVFDKIFEVPEGQEIVDLWDFAAYPGSGPSPVPLKLYLGGSTVLGKRCDTSKIPGGVKSHKRKLVAVARFAFPYCVMVKA
ncbi:phosphatidylinositol-4-phosphate 5-kinase [Pelomyxa schiedti]|nr:phosphatidylinositol-4-phosphate 5-kinase [Pelomyxa schiedti]